MPAGILHLAQYEWPPNNTLMAAPEVDVYGLENILARFDLAKCDDFAVFTASSEKCRLKFAASGRDVFEENIKSIDPNSDAPYQVRFYKKNFDEDNISPATEYNNSFNFKVRPKVVGVAAGSGNNGWQGLSIGDARYMSFLEGRVKELEGTLENISEELEEAKEQLEEYEEKGKKKMGGIGQIGEALEQYPQLNDMLKTITGFFAQRAGMTSQVPAGGLGNINTAGMDIDNMTPEVTEQTYRNAVTKLNAYYVSKYGQDKGDALFAKDLAKLAALTDKPFIFEAAISQLRTM